MNELIDNISSYQP